MRVGHVKSSIFLSMYAILFYTLVGNKLRSLNPMDVQFDCSSPTRDHYFFWQKSCSLPLTFIKAYSKFIRSYELRATSSKPPNRSLIIRNAK
ncbi:hypothetical protein Scep_014914 [Stephania cephalantha]|uniref:Uncharacterized protein n=1 Tax=Stephania cephalantha TaxID=152367 RepID=A0AAP0P0W0_9MAGN